MPVRMLVLCRFHSVYGLMIRIRLFFCILKLYACEDDFIFLRICCGKVSGGLNAGFEQFLTDRSGQIGRTIYILLR